MRTAVYNYIIELNERWKEVDILIEQAHLKADCDIDLYNALCRSVSILIVSHMEGFVKDITKNVILDLNYNLKFSLMPTSVKRTFCCKYLGADVGGNNRNKNIDLMIEDFSKYDQLKISYEPFLFVDNKNPNPSNIKNVLSRFGVSDVFKNLHQSRFDSTFESKNKVNINLRRLNKILLHVSSEFPYSADLKKFKLGNKKYNNRTLWEEFIDNLNHTRHKIVHGNTFDNLDSIQDIKLQQGKVRILQLLIVYVLCAKISDGVGK